MRFFGALLRNRATHASTEPASSLGHTVSVPCAGVCPNSPAKLLAKSLTDPETRDEWERTTDLSGYGHKQSYTNASREIVVSWGYTYGLGMYGGGGSFISTPFTLNKDEEKVVRDALKAFDHRLKEEAEQAALKRLVCCEPKRATKKRRGK